MSVSWEEFVPNVIQASLPRLLMDHSPVMLDGSRGRHTRTQLLSDSRIYGYVWMALVIKWLIGGVVMTWKEGILSGLQRS